MARPKKKRNKSYRGADAKITRPSIVRVSAENRGPLKEWWVNHKRIAKPVLIALGVALLIALLIDGLIGIFQ